MHPARASVIESHIRKWKRTISENEKASERIRAGLPTDLNIEKRHAEIECLAAENESFSILISRKARELYTH
jgi:hypothetical protein